MKLHIKKLLIIFLVAFIVSYSLTHIVNVDYHNKTLLANLLIALNVVIWYQLVKSFTLLKSLSVSLLSKVKPFCVPFIRKTVMHSRKYYKFK